MGVGSRLGLLMLTALLCDAYPPYRPPGSSSGAPDDDFETAVCPACGSESDEKSGNRYWCEDCSSYFIPGETSDSETS
jgi:hypothetical protein